MAATIIYSIDSGSAPFVVRLIGSDKPIQYISSLGIYEFTDVECGEYIIRITDSEGCLFHIQVSYPCPATTTTTTQIITTTTTVEPTTTTTTESLDEYPCGYNVNLYRDGVEQSFLVDVGTNTGAVILSFNAFYVPVRIKVEFDGIEVMDTGYRGSPVFQFQLNQALISLGYGTSQIVTPSQDELVFIKGTATEYAKIIVLMPLEGAIASIKLKCPVTTIETFEVAFTDRECAYETATTTTTEEQHTTTTTQAPVTTTTTEASTTTTTDCVPDGLLYTRNFYGYYSEYSGAPIIDFRSSEELACIARNGVINEGYSLNNGMAISAQKYYIGWQIYPLNCSMISGYYIYSGFWDTHYESNVLVRIINNVIVERIECPVVTTTTTDEPATTTTTTETPSTTTTTTETPSTTTTTTETPSTTTTTTTEGEITLAQSYGSAGHSFLGNCGSLTYPQSSTLLPLPSFIAERYFEPDKTYGDIEYIEVVSITEDANIDVTYNGTSITPGQKIYIGTGNQWEHGFVTTTAVQELIVDEGWTLVFKIKLVGYAITGDVTGRFDISACVSATTTTTT